MFLLQVLWWRTAASIGWTVLLSPVFITLTSFIASFDFLRPWTWLSSLLGILSGSVISGLSFHISCMTLLVTFMALLFAPHHSVRLVTPASRLQYILSVINMRRAVLYSTVTTGSALLGWQFASILTNSSLTYHSSELGSAVLNERHLFLVLFAGAVGLAFSTSFFMHNMNVIHFPIVQQAKYFRVRSCLLAMCVNSAMSSLKLLPYFFLAYYLILGQSMKDFTKFMFFCHEDPSSVVLNSIWGILNLSLAYQTWLCGCLTHILLSLPNLLHKVYHSEQFQFPIETNVEMYSNKCLHHALAADQHPHLLYLGHLDLYLLASQQPLRRTLIYNLTQLGGHALNWAQLSKVCLQRLEVLQQMLAAFNQRTIASAPLRQPSGGGNDLIVTDISHSAFMNGSTPGNESKSKPLTLSSKLRNLRFVKFFLDERPELSSRALFVDAQCHIWTVNALSHLASASFREDKYGVMQKSLASILEIMLLLQESLEKHLKLGLGSNGNLSRASSAVGCANTADCQTVHAAVKSALYRIVETFGKHLDSVELSTEQRRKIRMYVEYKE
ncbi:hypothetical protein CAPTEDRAFT_222928 [Capitella teleta]|uniref:Nucleoporin NDC1 n=1 Tax=Capitella teleta TaxID=283909 RepID=X2ATS2_CAPTE|nr:hypothetical protein CAPTEDRAFT_222928 [Capitella teleta]|eukprot:ELU04631.1 hypothetical protein CAPTEDRAFT_222928 [Capitella teleta]